MLRLGVRSWDGHPQGHGVHRESSKPGPRWSSIFCCFACQSISEFGELAELGLTPWIVHKCLKDSPINAIALPKIERSRMCSNCLSSILPVAQRTVPKLGTCLFSGDGIRRDVEKAASLFRKAAEQGAAWSRISGAQYVERWRQQISNVWEKMDPQSRHVITGKLLCHRLLCFQVVRDIDGSLKDRFLSCGCQPRKIHTCFGLGCLKSRQA